MKLETYDFPKRRELDMFQVQFLNKQHTMFIPLIKEHGTMKDRKMN